MYFVARSTPTGEGDVMVAKWLSAANHICNIHTDHHKIYEECDKYKNCAHGDYAIGEERLWLDPGKDTGDTPLF